VAPGVVQSVDESGQDGLQARGTYSSQPGDCGCVVLNTNSMCVGIHFSAGRPKVDNLFIPVIPAFLAANPKN